MRKPLTDLSLTEEQVEILNQYEPLLMGITKRYETMSHIEDLRQQCRMGMCEGIKTYDSKTGVPLKNYLIICIKSALRKYWKLYFGVTKMGEQDESGHNVGYGYLEEVGDWSDILEDSKDCFSHIFDRSEYILSVADSVVNDSKASERSKEIYRYYLSRTVINAPTTPTELGKKYGVSKQRIDQILNYFNGSVRKALEGKI